MDNEQRSGISGVVRTSVCRVGFSRRLSGAATSHWSCTFWPLFPDPLFPGYQLCKWVRTLRASFSISWVFLRAETGTTKLPAFWMSSLS